MVSFSYNKYATFDNDNDSIFVTPVEPSTPEMKKRDTKKIIWVVGRERIVSDGTSFLYTVYLWQKNRRSSQNYACLCNFECYVAKQNIEEQEWNNKTRWYSKDCSNADQSTKVSLSQSTYWFYKLVCRPMECACMQNVCNTLFVIYRIEWHFKLLCLLRSETAQILINEVALVLYS